MPTTPSIKTGHAVALGEQLPTGPHVRTGHAAAMSEQPPTSSRARTFHAVMFVLPPVSARVRLAIGVASTPIDKVWWVPPNWAEPVRETWTFATDVLVASDGTEQVRSLTPVARRVFSHDFAIRGFQVAQAEAVIRGLQGEEILVPIWTAAGRTTENIPIASATVPASGDESEYLSGTTRAALIVAKDDGESIYGTRRQPFEVVEYSGIEDGRLQLVKPTYSAWGPGSRVIPLKRGMISLGLSWDRPTADIAIGSVEIEVTEPEAIDESEAVVTYDGHEVLTHRPNRGEDITETFSRPVSRVGAAFGPASVSRRGSKPRIVRTRQLVGHGAAGAALRSWIRRRRGSWSPFWGSTSNRDLELARDAKEGESWISVKGARLGEMIRINHAFPALGMPRFDVEIRAFGQATIRRRILDVVTHHDGVDQLQLDAALPADIAVGSDVISWLELQRLASDSVTFEWMTQDAYTLDLAVVSP